MDLGETRAAPSEVYNSPTLEPKLLLGTMTYNDIYNLMATVDSVISCVLVSVHSAWCSLGKKTIIELSSKTLVQ